MTHLDVFNLSTIQHWRSSADDADPAEVAGAFERVIVPLYTGHEARPWRHEPAFTVTGEIGKKRSVVTLREHDAPLAVLGICLHSRASKPLLKTLTGIPDDQGLSVPWLVLRMEQDTMPPWVERWAEVVAWALMCNLSEIGE